MTQAQDRFASLIGEALYAWLKVNGELSKFRRCFKDRESIEWYPGWLDDRLKLSKQGRMIAAELDSPDLPDDFGPAVIRFVLNREDIHAQCRADIAVSRLFQRSGL